MALDLTPSSRGSPFPLSLPLSLPPPDFPSFFSPPPPPPSVHCPGHLQLPRNRSFILLGLHRKDPPRVGRARPGSLHFWHRTVSLLPLPFGSCSFSLAAWLQRAPLSTLLILLYSPLQRTVSPSPTSQQLPPSPPRMENSWRAGPCLSLSYLKGNSRACLLLRFSFLLTQGFPHSAQGLPVSQRTFLNSGTVSLHSLAQLRGQALAKRVPQLRAASSLS